MTLTIILVTSTFEKKTKMEEAEKVVAKMKTIHESMSRGVQSKRRFTG